MTKLSQSLTDRSVKSLATSRSQEDFFDPSVPGFGVRVSGRTGAKSWILLLSDQGRTRRLTLGKYPHVKLSEARARARDLIGRKARGESLAIGGPSVAEVADLYVRQYARPRKKSWAEDARILRTDVLPELGDRPLASVRAVDLANLLDRIVERGAPIMANRTRAVLSGLYRFAIARGFVDASPVAGIRPPARERARDRVLSPAEIRTLWESWSPIWTLGLSFRFRLLTAARGEEVLSATWEDVSIPDRVWTIPRTKAGGSHTIPLSSFALEVLEARAPSSEYLFPSPRGGRYGSTAPALAASRLRQRLGVAFVPHDLRRTAASNLAALGTPRVVIGRILGHSDSTVTAVYDRYRYENETRAALEEWATRVREIVGTYD